MTSRMKEEEKNEKIIRGLLKLPENRHCINCNGRGPQYVCTNFWIFICTTCSGIHREFTHRVKSISMAKFTSQEVTALQEGGNEQARRIFLKEWDIQRNPLPSSSNPDRLRDFIKHVYVERRYTGERSYEKPPRPNTDEGSHSHHGNGTSRGKPHEDAYDSQYDKRSNPSVRSPGYEQDRPQYEYRRSPTKNWQRDDKFGNERGQENTSDRGSKLEAQSSEQPKDLQISSHPGLQPVKDILSEKALPPRKIDPPETDTGRTAQGAVYSHRSASSNILASTSGNIQEVKSEKSVSLIDFDTDPEPHASASSQALQPPVNQTVNQASIATSQDNWACFDSIHEVQVIEPPKSANTLDSILSQLSVPASTPGHVSGTAVGDVMSTPVNNPAGTYTHIGSTHAYPANAGATTVVPSSSLSLFSQGGVLTSTPGLQPTTPATSGGSVSMHQQQSMFPTSNVQSVQQPQQPVGISSNQPRHMPVAPNLLQSTSTSTPQAPQSVTQPLPTTSRKELPVDLFTATYYPSIPAPFPGWQTYQPHGMGFPMQHNPAMTMLAFPQPMRSVNPFDPSQPSPAQPPAMQFPSMASWHGALPNVPPSSNLLQTTSLGSPSPAWMAPQGPFNMPAMPPQANPYASAVPQNAYMRQHAPGNVAVVRHQGVEAFRLVGSSATAGTNQPVTGSFSAPSTANSNPPATRNPFD